MAGKTADPCNQWVEPGFNGNPDCNSVPDSQSTIALPVTGTTHDFHVTAATRVLTLAGRGFTDSFAVDNAQARANFGAVGVTTHAVRMARIGRGCNDIDTTFAAITPTIVSDTSLTLDVPVSWTSIALELEEGPRMLCYSRQPAVDQSFFYTGFKIGVVYPCDHSPAVQRMCPAPATTVAYSHLTADRLLQRAARTTCCLGTIGLKVGQCIMDKTDAAGNNPQGPATCCGSAVVERATERCCSKTRETTAYHSTPCMCSTSTSTTSCPTGESCCLRTKYSELSADIGAAAAKPDLPGECYNPASHQCCDTGMRFDPGTSQCCSINGVQSNNIPCPCNNDIQCWGGQVAPALKNVAMRCCMQVNNSLAWEMSNDMTCNAYANYPNGTGPYQNQRCRGTCFDTTYQLCCNGVQCIKVYEKCCNSTCCNRFTQTCNSARRAGTPGNRYNFNNFAVFFETCSTIEQMQPLKAFWSVVWPTMLLLMTFLSTGLVLVFANKASSRSYAIIERTMINIGILAIILSLCIFFSPAWKYAATIIFVQLFTILCAASRIQRLNVWCLVLQVVLMIYLLDPFHGNQYLTLASSRQTNMFADRDSAGIFHYLGKMYKDNWNSDPAAVPAFCTQFYLGLFAYDNQLRDLDRFDNPAKTTFGLCDRGYVLVLLVLAAFLMIFVFLQLILTLLALLLRFTKPQVQLVVREDFDEDYQQ